MFYIRPSHGALAFFVGLTFNSIAAWAIEIKPSTSLSTQYTNNSRKVTFNREDEVIRIAGVGASLNTDTSHFTLDANTSLKYYDYTQNTFENKQYYNLDATANWAMLEDRIDWKLQDFFTQQSVNSLYPDTPENLQNTNVFTFGPDIRYRISGRQSLSFKPEYRKYTYQIQNTNNRQNSLDVSWNYQLFRTVNLGIRGGENKVDYVDPLVTDNTFTNIHLTFLTTRPDYDYSADLGSTHVERKDGNGVRGITGNMNWLFKITGYSNLRATISSHLTDSNSRLLNISIDPDSGDFSNQQISSEVLRNRVIRLTYQRSDVRLKSNIWAEWRNQNYEFALFDQEAQLGGFEFVYPLTALLSTGIYTRYSRIDLTDINRKDIAYNVGGNINYRFSRNLRGVLNFEYSETDSSVNNADFSETRVYINLVYGDSI